MATATVSHQYPKDVTRASSLTRSWHHQRQQQRYCRRRFPVGASPTQQPLQQAANVADGSCVTSIAGPYGDAQLYER